MFKFLFPIPISFMKGKLTHAWICIPHQNRKHIVFTIDISLLISLGSGP